MGAVLALDSDEWSVVVGVRGPDGDLQVVYERATPAVAAIAGGE